MEKLDQLLKDPMQIQHKIVVALLLNVIAFSIDPFVVEGVKNLSGHVIEPVRDSLNYVADSYFGALEP